MNAVLDENTLRLLGLTPPSSNSPAVPAEPVTSASSSIKHKSKAAPAASAPMPAKAWSKKKSTSPTKSFRTLIRIGLDTLACIKFRVHIVGAPFSVFA